MSPIDLRAHINRRAMQCPDAASFPGAGPRGHDGSITTVIERVVTSGGPPAKVIYLADTLAKRAHRRERRKA
jgi:hypothetical protein